MQHSLRPAYLLAALICAMGASALSVSVSVVHPVCNYANGSATAYPSGGVPPYTYSWSNGATTQAIVNMPVGTYTITVTDNVGTTAQHTSYLVSFGLDVPGSFSVLPACTPCGGEMTFDTTQFRGVAPYTFTPPASFYVGSVAYITGLCTGPATVTMQDVNGCNGGVSGIPIGAPAEPVVEFLDVLPGCNGQPNGSATIRISDDIGNFFLPGEVTVIGPGGTVYQDIPDDPVIGYTEIFLSGLVPGNYSVNGTTTTYCSAVPFSTGFDMPDIGPDCGSIAGTVYVDMDQDCIQDASDFALPYRMLGILPGNEYAITDANGTYLRALGYGSHQLVQYGSGMAQLCPAQAPIPFTLDNTAASVAINIADSSTVPFDLQMQCWLYAAVSPGLETAVHLDMDNYTFYPSGAVELTLDVPSYFTFVNASLAPTTVNPGQLTWSLAGLGAFGHQQIQITFLVDLDVGLIGSTATISAQALAATSEDISNNSCSSAQVVTAAFDPNDKQGRTSSALSPSQYFLVQDDRIDYTIRFQNTGNAPANDVVIRDTLDADFDISTLEILGASHNFTPSLHFERELIFSFNNINLPDSGSDYLGSQGFVSYRIRPNDDIIVGDELENTAGIYFDINPPIITNTVTHVVDFSTWMICISGPPPAIALWPNPATTNLTVVLSEEGARLIGVFDAAGSLIPLPMGRQADRTIIDTSTLSKGIYVVRTTSGIERFVRM